MRGLHFRHGVHPSEECPATSPSDSLVEAIDGALTFAISRELLTEEQVRSLFAMVRISSPLATEPGSPRDALEAAAATFEGRVLVSGYELADGLLDVRLCVRAPHDDTIDAWRELDPFVRTCT